MIWKGWDPPGLICATETYGGIWQVLNYVATLRLHTIIRNEEDDDCIYETFLHETIELNFLKPRKNNKTQLNIKEIDNNIV